MNKQGQILGFLSLNDIEGKSFYAELEKMSLSGLIELRKQLSGHSEELVEELIAMQTNWDVCKAIIECYENGNVNFESILTKAQRKRRRQGRK